MLLALMERKYQGYCAPTICIQELETAQRLQRHWRWCSDPSYASTHTTTSSSKARRLSHTLQEPSDDLHSTETSEQDPEERRVQMLRRHAQQIADTSVASTTGCGCKTGCLKMYCVCFSNRGYCHAGCGCDNCKNNSRTETSASTPFRATWPTTRAPSRSRLSSRLPDSNSFCQRKSSTGRAARVPLQEVEMPQEVLRVFPERTRVLTALSLCRLRQRTRPQAPQQLRAKMVSTDASKSTNAQQHIHVAMTKKPRRNLVQKTVRLRL
ncbi:hypothetical protein PINS_up020197 [Pythium insidiosum]|nr:hypothetical protein PINS_up020197 [Pythium insidiosum]